jgi:alpha-beta hydrolase superfamily lysophospholipase
VRPLAFDGLFGWLHPAQGASADTGVVLISPLGRDARCAHRPMRLLAERLAAAGYPTLRYDPLGEGDSLAPPDPEEDLTPHWLRGVEQAVDRLRAETGVRRVALGGVRLGASLAAVSAAHADGLILLAPVLNARAWLKRLRFAGAVFDTAAKGGGEPAALDAGGLWLSAATAASLGAIDLLAAPAPAVPVFVAAQNRQVAAYAAGLAERGAAVEAGDFPGFDALFLDAHSNEPPEAVFAHAAGWLDRTFGGARLNAAPAAPPTASAELRPPGAVERPVVFGDGLQGVLCEPLAPAPDAPAVIFLNTGGDPRAGVGGFAATAARRLAALGSLSLRFDFAGVGDSPMRGADARGHVYETPREADLDAALGLMAERGGRRIVVAGVCAGAYHAFRLAARDARVTGLFVVSPVKLVWRGGDSLAFGRKDDGKAVQTYVQALTDPATWRRLAAGGIDVAAVVRTLARRVTGRALGWVQGRTPDAPPALMRAFARRGGRACFVMGLDDASLDEVETYFGRAGAGLKRTAAAEVHIEARLDHGLARRTSREIALNLLTAWLGRPG